MSWNLINMLRRIHNVCRPSAKVPRQPGRYRDRNASLKHFASVTQHSLQALKNSTRNSTVTCNAFSRYVYGIVVGAPKANPSWKHTIFSRLSYSNYKFVYSLHRTQRKEQQFDVVSPFMLPINSLNKIRFSFVYL